MSSEQDQSESKMLDSGFGVNLCKYMDDVVKDIDKAEATKKQKEKEYNPLEKKNKQMT